MEEQTVNDLKKIGLHITEPLSFSEDNSGKLIGLHVEVAVMPNNNIVMPDFVVTSVNRRGVATHFSDFKKERRLDQDLVTFNVYQRMPDACDFEPIVGILAQSFIDFCWYAGNEAVSKDLVPETYTKLNPDALITDLGWYLPSRFADSVIDAIGKVNTVFFSGMLEDAILYGILFKKGQ